MKICLFLIIKHAKQLTKQKQKKQKIPRHPKKIPTVHSNNPKGISRITGNLLQISLITLQLNYELY